MSVKKLSVELEAKHGKTRDFILENIKLVSEKDDGKRFQVNQEYYTQFLEGRGITKETVKQVESAKSDYNNGTIAALTSLMQDDPEIPRITINTRTQGGVVSTRMTRKVVATTPGSGERTDKFGVVSIKQALKSRIDPELLAECSAQISECEK